jgi:single-strand DNA-binding protein
VSQITVTAVGTVGTEPNHLRTAEGTEVTTFRLVVTERRFDAKQQSWIDGDTSWFTVVSYKQLAVNVAGSVHKGDRVVVTGRLKLRDWTDANGRTGTSANIIADALGHELLWGTTKYERTARRPESAPPAAPSEGDDEEAAPAAADWGAPVAAGADVPF